MQPPLPVGLHKPAVMSPRGSEPWSQYRQVAPSRKNTTALSGGADRGAAAALRPATTTAANARQRGSRACARTRAMDDTADTRSRRCNPDAAPARARVSQTHAVPLYPAASTAFRPTGGWAWNGLELLMGEGEAGVA